MKVVLAGNIEQYEQWCKENKLARHSREAVAISNANSVRGMSLTADDVVCTGSWIKRDDLVEILSELRSAIR